MLARVRELDRVLSSRLEFYNIIRVANTMDDHFAYVLVFTVHLDDLYEFVIDLNDVSSNF